MSLYQCEKCGCVENTSTGFYHCRDTDWYKEYQENTRPGMKLCSVCGPLKYDDNKDTRYGKWHGRFTRKFYKLDSLYTDKHGNVRKKDNHKHPEDEDVIRTGE